ncbi:MAG: hypothetical protein ACJ77A_19585 [Actinomycetota bacterium]
MAAQRRDKTSHLSLRVRRELHERLTRAAGSGPESRSSLAARLIEEGLRMDSHPGIVFRGGPGGRRPGLAGGPDVWEVVRVLRAVRGADDKRVRRTAELTDLPVHSVRAAARYYSEFPEEIHRWIEAVDKEAELDSLPPTRT